MTPAMYAAATVDALSPCIAITCADVVAEYVQLKQQQGNPASALEAAERMTTCAEETRQRLDNTCGDLYHAYSICLVQQPRTKCHAVKLQLQECIAEHIGKLD